MLFENFNNWTSIHNILTKLPSTASLAFIVALIESPVKNKRIDEKAHSFFLKLNMIRQQLKRRCDHESRIWWRICFHRGSVYLTRDCWCVLCVLTKRKNVIEGRIQHVWWIRRRFRFIGSVIYLVGYHWGILDLLIKFTKGNRKFWVT